jgi:uncharacterized membrane protein YkvA (DUF1232 family)
MSNEELSPAEPEASPLQGSAPDAEASEIVDVLREAAARVLQRRFRVALLVRNAYERMLSHSDVLSAVWTDLRTMLRLLVHWANRSYQRVSWTPLVLIVVALLYFVVPADAVPDALGALGFVDDVSVITMVVGRVRDELDRFRAWEGNEALSD